jgi:hypothetical protein
MPFLHFSHHLQWIEDDASSTSSARSVVGIGFVIARVEVTSASSSASHHSSASVAGWIPGTDGGGWR